MRDALLVIDAITDFRHPGGNELHESFREHQPTLLRVLDDARAVGVPVIYVNDDHGAWDWTPTEWIQRTIDASPADGLVAAVAPQEGDVFVGKVHPSAFDHTALDALLDELEVERILLAGGGEPQVHRADGDRRTCTRPRSLDPRGGLRLSAHAFGLRGRGQIPRSTTPRRRFEMQCPHTRIHTR